MYKIAVEIEEQNGWFAGDGPLKPHDMDYCIVVHKYGDGAPVIGQWIERESYWVDMSEAFVLSSIGCLAEWEPGIIDPNIVDIWKPLGLPPDLDAKLKKTVKSWYEE